MIDREARIDDKNSGFHGANFAGKHRAKKPTQARLDELRDESINLRHQHEHFLRFKRAGLT